MPFRKKIDNCRDYLVGKIPDPKGQVDQITNAMIYKFMSDLDQISLDAGGIASYFVDQKEVDRYGKITESSLFEKHSWKKLFDSKLTNTERAQLYIDGLEKLSDAKHLPDFFQNIFKDAYLPFRDANTIIHFLTEIDGFEYSNSEDLGNAFEYLLKIMGSQGNAGQFRTPRHIIDFLVDIVDPKPGQTIYDPACGTAGFLISAYKHILKNNTLTPTQKLELSEDISGVDIDPGMAKIARVNLFFHDFKSPKISEDDTLSNQKLWGKKFDVILANPPFMTPRGGIHPHDGYTINSTKAEVLFTSYIAQHLKLGGKAGIIVPEGIIFQAANAYKQLRKMLIDENLLYAVVSLPAGIFQPYSGVKTSILLLDRNLAPKTTKILFAKVEQDGFSMSTQRKEHVHNDLPEILQEIRNYKTSIQESTEYKSENLNVFTVEKSKLIEDGEYNFSAERYREAQISSTEYDLVELGEVLQYEQPTKYIVSDTNYSDEYKTPVLTAGKSFVLGHTNEQNGIFPKEKLPVIIFDDFTTATKYVDFEFKVKSSAMKILHCDHSKAYPQFLYHIIQNIKFPFTDHKRYWISQYSKIKIPLPPLDIQQLIVDELDGYQKIIDGAKQVVDNYKPTIEIDESWEIVELGEVCKLLGGYAFSSSDFSDEGTQVIKMANVKEGFFDKNNKPSYVPNNFLKNHKKYSLGKGDILISMTGTIGKEDYGNICMVTDGDFLLNQRVGKFEADETKLNNNFLYYVCRQESFKRQVFSLSSGGVRQSNISGGSIEKINIPLPKLEEQRKIVSKIETEQSYVNGCKYLIKIFEKKIENKVSEIWGEKSLNV